MPWIGFKKARRTESGVEEQSHKTDHELEADTCWNWVMATGDSLYNLNFCECLDICKI